VPGGSHRKGDLTGDDAAGRGLSIGKRKVIRHDFSDGVALKVCCDPSRGLKPLAGDQRRPPPLPVGGGLSKGVGKISRNNWNTNTYLEGMGEIN